MLSTHPHRSAFLAPMWLGGLVGGLLCAAVADLVFIVVCVPFTAVLYALPVWPFGTVFCKVRYLAINRLVHKGTALPVNKPETTAVVIIARWPQVSHTAFSYSTYSRRHAIG